MLVYKSGNIFHTSCQGLVIPTNCVGAMGVGLALEFKKRCPGKYLLYKDRCDGGEHRIGTTLCYTDEDYHYYLLPTKKHYKDKSKYHYIAMGLCDLRYRMEYNGILSIAIPAIGCGAGGLLWDNVKEIIEDWYNSSFYLQSKCYIEIYGPI